MNIQFVTDHACIYCFIGEKIFPSTKGQQISITAIEKVQSINTIGLKYALDKESFPPASNGISNEAEGEEFTIDTSHPAWLFINHPE